MPVRRRQKYQPPKKYDAQYQQITHDLTEKSKRDNRDGMVTEM